MRDFPDFADWVMVTLRMGHYGAGRWLEGLPDFVHRVTLMARGVTGLLQP